MPKTLQCGSPSEPSEHVLHLMDELSTPTPHQGLSQRGARFSISLGMGESAFKNGKVPRDHDLRKSSHRRSFSTFKDLHRHRDIWRKKNARAAAVVWLTPFSTRRCRQLERTLPLSGPWAVIDHAPKHICELPCMTSIQKD